MNAPWTEGPHELLRHAADHMRTDGDFDRRAALISIDNAVELTVKTYLGLPERTRGSAGPSRRELDQAGERFPALLDLCESYASSRISGVSLGDIEWYHRIRNQLYHSGNGITVDRSSVEAYFQIAATLFENLFDVQLVVDESDAINTATGEFLGDWAQFDRELRTVLPPKEGLAYFWKRDFLSQISPEMAATWEELNGFRNALAHGGSQPSAVELRRNLNSLAQLRGSLKARSSQFAAEERAAYGRSLETGRRRSGGATVCIGEATVVAASVIDLYEKSLKLLVDEHQSDLRNHLPFATSDQRYLVSTSPVHPNGRQFVSPVGYRGFYMEAHKDYKNALSHLGKLARAMGLTFSEVPRSV